MVKVKGIAFGCVGPCGVLIADGFVPLILSLIDCDICQLFSTIYTKYIGHI